jgi:hypothetical protein
MRGERVKLLFHRIFDAMITLTYVVQWVVKELKQICDMKGWTVDFALAQRV